MIALLPYHDAGRRRRIVKVLDGALTAIRRSALAVALSILLPGVALAHSFTAALLVVGENREANLAEAVRGFLLAADERDGHANETSDGHLGGIDVQVLPLPPSAAGGVEGLIGSPSEPADVVLVLGPKAAAREAEQYSGTASAILLQDVLPAGWDGNDATGNFVARYRLAYGMAPGAVAATAYHAARRLDVAIRQLDGVAPRADLEQAWQSTASGLPW